MLAGIWKSYVNGMLTNLKVPRVIFLVIAVVLFSPQIGGDRFGERKYSTIFHDFPNQRFLPP